MTGPIFDEVQWSKTDEEAIIQRYKEMLVPMTPQQIEDQIRWQDLRDACFRFTPAVPIATEADELHRAEREGIVRGAQDSPAARGE